MLYRHSDVPPLVRKPQVRRVRLLKLVVQQERLFRRQCELHLCESTRSCFLNVVALCQMTFRCDLRATPRYDQIHDLHRPRSMELACRAADCQTTNAVVRLGLILPLSHKRQALKPLQDPFRRRICRPGSLFPPDSRLRRGRFGTLGMPVLVQLLLP